MSNFFISRFNTKRREFSVPVDITLPMHNINRHIIAKIDTGCNATSIALSNSQFSLTAEEVKSFRSAAIANNLEYKLSRGVNDTAADIEEAKRNAPYDKRYCFYHKDAKISVDEVDIELPKLKVGYLKESSLLIGMDILSQFTSIFGLSLVEDQDRLISVGDFIMIAGVNNAEDKAEFYDAVHKYLGFIPSDKEK